MLKKKVTNSTSSSSSGLALQCGHLLLQLGVDLVHLGATAAATLAANNARRRQQQKRRCHQQQNTKASKYANNLGAMPDDRGTRMTQFVLAGPLVVVPQQKIILWRKKGSWISEYISKGECTLLTSRLARQYQQKTCLHRLHIIWAQPSSFSMGTAHMGQHLMSSLSNGIPISSWPSAIRRRPNSSQLILGWYCKNRMKDKGFTSDYLSRPSI